MFPLFKILNIFPTKNILNRIFTFTNEKFILKTSHFGPALGSFSFGGKGEVEIINCVFKELSGILFSQVGYTKSITFKNTIFIKIGGPLRFLNIEKLTLDNVSYEQSCVGRSAPCGMKSE